MDANDFSLDLDSEINEHGNRVKTSLTDCFNSLKEKIKELENESDSEEEESETAFITSRLTRG